MEKSVKKDEEAVIEAEPKVVKVEVQEKKKAGKKEAEGVEEAPKEPQPEKGKEVKPKTEDPYPHSVRFPNPACPIPNPSGGPKCETDGRSKLDVL